MANDAVQVQIDDKQVNERLKALQLGSKDTQKAFAQATRDGLAIIRKAVIAGASAVTSNSEKRTSGVRYTAYRQSVGGRVDILKAFYQKRGGRGRKVFILKWLEAGTAAGEGRNGKMHGATPAKPFFRAAAQSGINAAVRKTSDLLLRRLDKLASGQAK